MFAITDAAAASAVVFAKRHADTLRMPIPPPLLRMPLLIHAMLDIAAATPPILMPHAALIYFAAAMLLPLLMPPRFLRR